MIQRSLAGDLDAQLRHPFRGGGVVEKSIPLDTGDGLSVAIQRFLNLGGNDSVTKPFLENAFVHTCLTLYGEQIQGIPFKLKLSDDDDAEDVPDTDPLVQWFNNPPHPLISGPELHRSLMVDFLHDGEEFWFFDGRDKNGLPKDLTVVRGDHVDEWWEDKGHTKLKGWKYEQGGVEKRYALKDSVWFPRSNPYGLRGVGVVTALSRTIENYFQAERFDDAILRNGGVPSGKYMSDAAITPTQAAQIQEAHQRNHAAPEKHRRPMVLGMGMRFESDAWSPQDMEFSLMRTHLEDIILMGFRTPRAMIAMDEEEGTFSRAGQDSKIRVWHRSAAAPHLRHFEHEIQTKFIDRLPAPFNRYRCYYDDAGLLDETIDELIERTVTLKRDGGLPFKVAAQLAGWDLPEDVEIPDEPDPNAEGDQDNPGGPQAPPESAENGDQAVSSSISSQLVGKSSSPSAPFNRAAATKAFADGLIPHDEKLARVIAIEFRRYIAESKVALRVAVQSMPVAASLSTKDFGERELEQLLPALAAFQDRFGKAVEPVLIDLFLEQSAKLAEQIGGKALRTAQDIEVLGTVLQRRIPLVEGATSTLAKQVQATILKTLTNGPSTATLADAIRRTLEELDDQLIAMADRMGERAMLIARTETTAGANGARVLTMKRNGIAQHEWGAALDGATRADHAELDGEVRVVGEVFRHNLRFPGDSQAHVSQVANCRCTTFPALEGFDDE